MDLRHEEIGLHFDRKVRSFDGIYTGEKSFPGRIWDKLTRKNIGERFKYTLRAFEPMAGKRVLDAGCGSGRYCFKYAQAGASHVLGVDSSKEMINMSDKLSRDYGTDDICEFKVMNIMDVEEVFDYTSAIGFFDYVNAPGAVLRHLRKLTTERFVASFAARLAFRYPARKLWFVLQGIPIRFYTRKQVEEMVSRAGFQITDIVKSGPIYIVRAE